MIGAAWETLWGAVRTLRANKLRSALTLLGIVIGVVAVVAMAATTEGLRRKIHEDLSQLGTGVFQVQKQPVFGQRGRDRAWERRKDFTMREVEALRDRCEGCLRVGGEAWEPERRVAAGDRAIRTVAMAVGGTPEFYDNNGYALASGRFHGEAEEASGAEVVVIGADLVDLLFPRMDPLGQTLRVRGRPFRVVGTLQRRGAQLGGGSVDNLVVMPLSRFLPLYGARRSLNVTIQARDPARVARTQDEVVQILRRVRAVPPQADDDFEMFSNASVQDTFEDLSGTIATASVGICAIALLIGGIGVMNIMLVAVTERTSEIGVRRALGARRRRILGQFVVEAVALTSLGGAVGLGLGALVALLVEILVGIPTVVPPWAIVLSLASSSAVGLVFGIYPAWRASRLDPVEAMRYE